MDLRKPKRFATFSLGLGKKKKKPDENISKSTFGLSSTDAGNEVMCDSLTLISGRLEMKYFNILFIHLTYEVIKIWNQNEYECVIITLLICRTFCSSADVGCGSWSFKVTMQIWSHKEIHL